MYDFNFKKPDSSDLGDHDVKVINNALVGRRIALLITGGIAAYKMPSVVRLFRRYGADVTVYLSTEAKRYVGADALAWASNKAVVESLTPRAEHLSDSEPFDIYIVAPATYNTINKFSLGIADTPITSTLATALGRAEAGLCKVVVVPTMHGDMHNSILETSVSNLLAKGVQFIPPVDENGKHNTPTAETIVAYTAHFLNRAKGLLKQVLVTAGPTPTEIDDVRVITNKFRGTLGTMIAEDLFLRGFSPLLVSSTLSLPPPSYLEHVKIGTYEEYKGTVLALIDKYKFEFGVFSAAVADYKVKQKVNGKIKSGTLTSLELDRTEKVIDIVQERYPDMKMISFKYEDGITESDLLKLGAARIQQGHWAVIVNRGEDYRNHNNHVAFKIMKNNKVEKLVGKREISESIVNEIIAEIKV